MTHPLDGIALPYRLRRTELLQSPQGDFYVDLHDNETIVAIDFSPVPPTTYLGGGGGGNISAPRKPVVWIHTNEIVTEVMGDGSEGI